jgi:hypothetical protein
MKTCFASKVILIFQEALEYVDVINICYTWKNSSLQVRVPLALHGQLLEFNNLNHIIHKFLLN